MHVYCLHWLISTGLLFQSAFADHVNSVVKWCKWRALNWQWRPDIVPINSTLLLYRTCSGILWSIGMRVSAITTLNSVVCVVLLLCFYCYHAPPTPPFPCTPISMLAQNCCIPWKSHQKVTKISHYLFVRLVVQKLSSGLPSKYGQWMLRWGWFGYFIMVFLKCWQVWTRLVVHNYNRWSNYFV